MSNGPGSLFHSLINIFWVFANKRMVLSELSPSKYNSTCIKHLTLGIWKLIAILIVVLYFVYNGSCTRKIDIILYIYCKIFCCHGTIANGFDSILTGL